MSETTKPESLSFLDFIKFDIRTGEILSVEVVPKSKKLVKLEVDFGTTVGKRTILAGIAQAWVEGRVMVGQRVVAVINLAPREMMGVESKGMILATHDSDDKVWLLNPGGPILPGTEVG